MGFFGAVKKGGSWLAVNIAVNGLYAVSVLRGAAGKPVVALAAFHSLEKSTEADALEKFGKQLQARQHRCTTLLSHGQYQLLSVDAPNVPAGEQKAAVRWQMKDMIDFPVEQATIDLIDVPGDKAAPGRTMFAVAARNSVIEQRQTLFAKAKIALSVIDIPDMAQRNISSLLELDGRGVAMLSFDAAGGLLTVTHGGELYLSRHIDVSLAQVTAQVMAQVTAQGTEQGTEQGVADDAQNSCFDRITLALQRSLDHCDRQYHFIVIAKLVLAPIAAPALLAHLAANMYMPVEMLDLADVVDLSLAPDLLQAEQQQRFFLCVGAALRQEENVA